MRHGWRVAAFLGMLIGGLNLTSHAAEPGRSMILVVGAPGESEFGEKFQAWAATWKQVASKAGVAVTDIGLQPEGTETDLAALERVLGQTAKSAPSELWLVFIGHGTFDGRETRFNLRGPDLTVSQLDHWLEPVACPLMVLNTASASGPFINQLSRTNRVVVTATRNGLEQNFTRFGQHLAESIGDPSSDLDKDGQVSLLEAFLFAARQTEAFYHGEGRLATEHALLDDNGDKAGTPADWFRGVRAVKKSNKGAVDGLRAHQIHLVRSQREDALSAELRSRRDELERSIAALRERKANMPEQEYYAELETLMVRLAEIYR